MKVTVDGRKKENSYVSIRSSTVMMPTMEKDKDHTPAQKLCRPPLAPIKNSQ